MFETKIETKILAIVPAFNEEHSITKVIEDLRSIKLPIDILIVNDGSTDNTSFAARQTGKTIVLDLSLNLGIGGAVQAGFIYACQNNYHLAIQFDGDAQHIASEIEKILIPVIKGEADVVIGSRFLENRSKYKTDFVRKLGIIIFQVVISVLNRKKITDCTSGFRAYNYKAIKFFSDYYPADFPEPEAVILLIRNGFILKEVMVEMRQRGGGISSISLLDGVYYMIKVTLAIFMTVLRTIGKK